MGALTYKPSYQIQHQWQSKLTLEHIAADCEAVLQGKDHDILPELIIAGGSPGGARPKALIAVDKQQNSISTGVDRVSENQKLYLVKFSTMTEINDAAELEYAYYLMAKDCGINMTSAKLFDAGKYGKAFGIERFDREANRRVHVHTLSGLLHADYRIPNLDYIEYGKAIWALTQNKQQVAEGFRRMVFNVMAHVRDDHSKNFSFLLDEDSVWQLSPAYDLIFSPGIAGEHTMTIAGEGANPTTYHLLRIANKMQIDIAEANNIIEQVKSVVEKFNDYAETASVPTDIKNNVARALKNIQI